MEKLKNKKVGRPKYQPNIEQLKQLFKQVSEKTITNEEAWRSAKCRQDQMVWTKAKISVNTMKKLKIIIFIDIIIKNGGFKIENNRKWIKGNCKGIWRKRHSCNLKNGILHIEDGKNDNEIRLSIASAYKIEANDELIKIYLDNEIDLTITTK